MSNLDFFIKDELQDKAAGYVEAKTSQTKFSLLKDKILFGVTIVLLAGFIIFITICAIDALPGVQRFIEYLR